MTPIQIVRAVTFGLWVLALLAWCSVIFIHIRTARRQRNFNRAVERANARWREIYAGRLR